ncbi:MAG: sugar transferase [Hyphomonas sp.]|nr:sugar transferase [Hyphomonas sp.]MCB9972791.1 sugar transferase [Hyphomonas sp.]HPE47610.1 sugar transferase [Hyphomonas sp.]
MTGSVAKSTVRTLVTYSPVDDADFVSSYPGLRPDGGIEPELWCEQVNAIHRPPAASQSRGQELPPEADDIRPETADIPAPLAAYQWRGRPERQAFKRALDICGSLGLLVFLAPLLLAVWLILRLSGKGPVFFSQERVGQFGQTFRCLKFRTMVPDAAQRLEALLRDDPAAAAEWDDTRKLKNDPRITPLGDFLRKSSIDELPQLINILRGEMSLVGPRPVVFDEISRYGLDVIFYLRERPGLTGLWQVSGRSDTTYDERVLLDRAYSLRRSFWLDVRILLQTIPAVLKRKGAT